MMMKVVSNQNFWKMQNHVVEIKGFRKLNCGNGAKTEFSRKKNLLGIHLLW
jgi:hypothetical protein